MWGELVETAALNVVLKSVHIGQKQKFQFMKTKYSGEKLINAVVHLCEPARNNFREKVKNRKIEAHGRRTTHH